MHEGPFDDELATVALLDAYLERNGYVNDMNAAQLHHEIYLSDARKAAPEKWKTVIRHPIKKAQIFHFSRGCLLAETHALIEKGIDIKGIDISVTCCYYICNKLRCLLREDWSR